MSEFQDPFPSEPLPEIGQRSDHKKKIERSSRRLFGEPASEQLRLLRERIFAEIPQDLEGINIERVEKYIQEQGYDTVPYMVIDKKNRPDLYQLMRTDESYSHWDENKGEEGGFYDINLQMVVIYRDQELEKKNSAVYTESMLVHELSHASITKIAVTTSKGIRIGALDTSKNTGNFLEEGFADLNAIDYRAQFLPELEKAALCGELGIYAKWYKDQILQAMGDNDLPYFFIGSAAFLREDGGTGVVHSSIAASTLSIIRANNPEVWEDLKESRRDPRALRKVRDWFNKKGGADTWKTMQEAPYQREEFARTQQLLLN